MVDERSTQSHITPSRYLSEYATDYNNSKNWIAIVVADYELDSCLPISAGLAFFSKQRDLKYIL